MANDGAVGTLGSPESRCRMAVRMAISRYRGWLLCLRICQPVGVHRRFHGFRVTVVLPVDQMG